MPNIPDRWIPYKACGKVIEGTRFICFKVPLRKNVQSSCRDIKEIWDIATLLKKIPKLGAVIDLTNTARYYNPAELQAAGVLYKKILMPGRIIPPENKVTEFMDAVDEFLGKDCEFLVGVHCTHGLNRTGYMVCRYMRDRLGVPAKDAIKKFEKARGYQIERENYIADLIGEEPPPPDVGSDTVVKPIDSTNKPPYRRSVVNEEYEDEDNQCTNTYNRPSRGRYYKDNRSSRRNAECDKNWRQRDEGHSGTTRDRSNSRQSSYNYKYDY